MEKEYEIVSLGMNCLVRTILTRNNLKPRKAQGELTCPFDIVKTPFDRIVYYLKTDFQDYLDEFEFKIRKQCFLDFRKKGLWSKPDGTTFYHDKDCKAGDLEKLRIKLSKRIDNFHNIVNGKKPVYFVLALYDKTDKLPELFEILKNYRNGKKFKLIVLNFADCVYEHIDGIHCLNMAAPIDNYEIKWDHKPIRGSMLGDYIDKCICNYVANIIKEDNT